MNNKNDCYNVVVLASGGGSNFVALSKRQRIFKYNISLLIVDRICGAIDKAKELGIPYLFIDKKLHKENFFDDLEKAIPLNTNLIVLAGFMPIINEAFCCKWKGRIINTHPSLLPKYGGKGMYGVKVQEAVMKNNEKYAGCTVHFVTAEIDRGEIILQKKIIVDYNETPWQLGGRIHKEENKILAKSISLIMRQNCRHNKSI